MISAMNHTEAEAEDDAVFEALFNEWSMPELLTIETPTAQLRAICELWFMRGIRHGIKWADKTVDKVRGKHD